MQEFSPRLDILPPPQRKLWDELGATPPQFTLYGGTAIALQLGHRQSVDFDFFGGEDFDPNELLSRIPYLRGGTVVQNSPSTLSVWIDRDGDTKVSFFGVSELGEVEAPRTASGSVVKVASLLDLAGLKTVVVQSRAEAKDFIDLDALLLSGVALADALAAAKIVQGPSYNPQISLKALCYFDDGDLRTLSAGLKSRLKSAVGNIDLQALPKLRYNRAYGERAGRRDHDPA